MKLRIRKNSIRIRLSQDDLDRLAEEGRIVEGISFGEEPDQRFEYGIVADDSTSDLAVVYGDGSLTVHMNHASVGEWRESDRVGYEEEFTPQGGEEVRLLIEKDFKCRTPRSPEEDEGAFDNPNPQPHS